ncbi:MAG TPA: 23S rRNA (adenine(2030)-N(6))-methyltransferase RlmJ [Methylophilaceae bacterium]|nr:23S rRNA (adenine(2030)-N(6))-methyltransferase RlmJ [Methylophilaceae bacterium]
MLSYRHAFHAGNHADVLKHYVLTQVLDYASGKEKPLWYIDTHAGAGMYALDQGYASQNAEHAGGIGRLWSATDLPPSLAEYVAMVKGMNPDHAMRFYPGSPQVAQALLRKEDRIRLFELHPTDAKLLRQRFKDAGRQVMIETTDGFAGLKASLPPPSRRAVVLIDPPYEEKQDYQSVVRAIEDSLQRFATGTYILWYPLLQRPEPLQMLERLARLPLKSWLHVSLTVQQPSIDGFGMYGSGLFIVNPPWTLPALLAESMPILVKKLGLDSDADYRLEHHIP